MKRKIIHIFDPIYMQNIYLLYLWDKNDVLKWAKRDLPNIEIADGMAFWADGRIAIWVKRSIRTSAGLSNLVHEIGHVAFAVLNDRGVYHTEQNHEPFCYYMGWLTKNLLNEIKKLNR